MTEVIAGLTDVFAVVGKVLTEMTSTPIMLFFLAASIVPVGIGLFKKLKKAAK